MTNPIYSRKIRHWFRRLSQPALPSVFRRTTPISAVWGFDRGTPIDRYYIENFLRKHRRDITGHTLEVADTGYTNRFGIDVTHVDILDVDSSNEAATLVADLSIRDQIPESAFECFICTQTLHFIYDIKEAIRNAYRLLRYEGVLLATLPCVSRVAAEEREDHWRLTVDSCSRLFAEVFGAENVTVSHCGSVATCVAFLQGVAAEEMSHRKLEQVDSFFPLIICVRAVKIR